MVHVNRVLRLQECADEAGFAWWLCRSPKDRLCYAELHTATYGRRNQLRHRTRSLERRLNLRRTGVRKP